MAVLDILLYPDPFLRKTAEKVTEFNDNLKQTVKTMWDTHYAQKNCAALAATQLGIDLAITVIDFSENKDQPLCLINPEIIEKEGMTNTPEGCMSIPGITAPVKRAEKIKLRYQDVDGKEHMMDADDFLAKCIQHEMDHLIGVLFIDHQSKLKKKMLLSKYQSLSH